MALISMGPFGGVIWLLLAILNIYAIIRIVTSSMESTMKLVWILIVIFVPIIGSILYFVIGDQKK